MSKLMPRSLISVPVLVGAVAVLAISTGSGCSWVKSKFTAEAPYREAEMGRPLEAPPGLDLPRNAGAFEVPRAVAGSAGGLSSAPPDAGGASPVAISDFVVADSLDSTWRRIGLALARIDGASVVGQSQLLNSYEVSYEGQTLLIRAEANGEQSRVSALGADGRTLSGGSAAKLLGLLSARLN